MEIENKALRPPNEPKSDIRIGPIKVAHEKIRGIIKIPRIEKGNSSFGLTHVKSHDIKWEHTQNLCNTVNKSHTPRNKSKYNNYSNISCTTHRSINSNQGILGRYLEYKSYTHKKNQRNGPIRGVPQHTKKHILQKKDNSTKRNHMNNKYILARKVNKSSFLHNAQESHRTYPTKLSQESNSDKRSSSKSLNITNTTLCHYCCQKGHTLDECRFRRKSNLSNVVWMPKLRNN